MLIKLRELSSFLPRCSALATSCVLKQQAPASNLKRSQTAFPRNKATQQTQASKPKRS